jgi:hypothetical protein
MQQQPCPFAINARCNKSGEWEITSMTITMVNATQNAQTNSGATARVILNSVNNLDVTAVNRSLNCEGCQQSHSKATCCEATGQNTDSAGDGWIFDAQFDKLIPRYGSVFSTH